MSYVVRPRLSSKGGIYQLLICLLWIALGAYGFYHSYFYRLGRYGNDMPWMILCVTIVVIAIASLIQLAFARALVLDDKCVRVRSLFGTKVIQLSHIHKAWYMLSEPSIPDFIFSSSFKRRAFKAIIGFDGEKAVIFDKTIGRGWRKEDLKAFCDHVNTAVK